jgi:hypothetical protein
LGAKKYFHRKPCRNTPLSSATPGMSDEHAETLGESDSTAAEDNHGLPQELAQELE